MSRPASEERSAEAALREKEAQYRGIFEASSDGLDVTDLETGIVVEANPAFCRMLGYTHAELVGRHAATFIHPDDLHLFDEYLATVKAGGEFRCRARNVRKDGSVFPVEVVGKSFIYSGRRHVLGVVRDVTEQVEAERVLEQRVEERTRELGALYRPTRRCTARCGSRTSCRRWSTRQPRSGAPTRPPSWSGTRPTRGWCPARRTGFCPRHWRA